MKERVNITLDSNYKDIFSKYMNLAEVPVSTYFNSIMVKDAIALSQMINEKTTYVEAKEIAKNYFSLKIEEGV